MTFANPSPAGGAGAVAARVFVGCLKTAELLFVYRSQFLSALSAVRLDGVLRHPGDVNVALLRHEEPGER